MIEALKSRAQYDRTLIVVTADHGELMGEHRRIGHGDSLLEGELRIPLIVKPPRGGPSEPRDGASQRITEPIQLHDLPRLILGEFGIRGPDAMVRARRDDAVFAEVYPPPAISPLGDWRVLIDGDFKFHWNSRGKHMLFDLSRDPTETVNLIASEPERAAAMERALDAILAALPAPALRDGAPGAVDEETLRALEALGYLEEQREQTE